MCSRNRLSGQDAGARHVCVERLESLVTKECVDFPSRGSRHEITDLDQRGWVISRDVGLGQCVLWASKPVARAFNLVAMASNYLRGPLTLAVLRLYMSPTY